MSMRDMFDGGRSRIRESRMGYDRGRNMEGIRSDLGLRIHSVTLVETGTYNPEFLRSYMVSTTRQDIDELHSIVDDSLNDHGAGSVAPADISGVTGRMLNYSRMVTDEDLIDINGGWDESRLSFIIEVVELGRDEYGAYDPDREIVTYLSGYTDRMDISMHGEPGRMDHIDAYLAPDTEFMVTNISRVERGSRRVATNNQLIIPAYMNKQRFNSRESLFVVRPKDVFTNETIMEMTSSGMGKTIQNAAKLHTGSMKPSRASNLNPSQYMASSINALLHASLISDGSDPYGNYDVGNSSREHIYSSAKSRLREDTGLEANSFTAILRSNTSFGKDMCFTWSELCDMFPDGDIDDITDIYQQDEVEIEEGRTAIAGDSAGWDDRENRGQNAVFATVLKQTLPGLALTYLINQCRIEAFNILTTMDDEEDAVAGAVVIVSDVVFAADLGDGEQERKIRQFEEDIARIILRDLSLNNAITYEMFIDLNWRFDSFYTIAIEGGPLIEFSSAGFAGSLTTPILSTSRETALDIGNDLRAIIRSIGG